ncbi:MAG: amidohydrolase [Bacteroidetes bacterium]|nr:amidohydrolase [Bacteroidota bacterium]MDA1121396.1 amidohydrolase [Bacteroidota bacterium]
MFPYLEQIKKLFTIGNVVVVAFIAYGIFMYNRGLITDLLFGSKEKDELPKVTADLVIRDARIWTGNKIRPWEEAIAVSADTIVALGNTKDINKLIGKDTQIIEAKGLMVTPGFIDSHIHFLELGLELNSVQLRNAASKEEFVKRIAEYASKLKPGDWITGGAWDHTLWGGELPDKSWIDDVTPNNPVWLSRLDGHMGLSNSIALNKAGITKKTNDVEGGIIVKSENGELTGIFKDNAQNLIFEVIPARSMIENIDLLRKAMDFLASNGVTSVTHMDGNIEVFQEARKEHVLKTRTYIAVPLKDWEQLKELIDSVGFGDEWIKIGALKGFVDGSLGSRTAAFMRPYNDMPSDSGLYVMPPEEMINYILDADEAGLQLMIHAIGDRANHELLDMFDSAIRTNGPRDRRFKIEHAQHLLELDIARFKDLNVIASMQPLQLTDDFRWAEKAIGPERLATTYAFRSLLYAGTLLVFGSDAPVVPPSVFESIYAAVTRRTNDEIKPDGWVSSEKISVEDALVAYTCAGAYASFDEGIKGTLEPGKLADFVIIDRDLTTIPVAEIHEAQVLRTYVGGNMVYHHVDN